MMRTIVMVAMASALIACDEDEPAPTAADPEAAALPEAEPEVEQPPPPNGADEACAQVIVVAYAGAAYAAEDVTRSEDEARARAETLRGRVEGGESFAEVARAESDAQSSGPRGGLIGTYRREEWPDAHGALRDPLFALSVGQITEVVEAPYGYAIAKRCEVEKVHTRHVLVRYAGARNAGADVVRSEEAARALADEILTAIGNGADFETVARERSEDSSADRGGDLGPVGRGRLAPAYEDAAFALQPGQVSDVVQTEFGFHIIQRVE